MFGVGRLGEDQTDEEVSDLGQAQGGEGASIIPNTPKSAK